MDSSEKQKPPKTIKEIVADLRSKGELDEEKWKNYQEVLKSGRKYLAKAYIIPSLVSIWMIFFGCSSLKCVLIYIAVLTIFPFVFMRSVVYKMATENIYLVNYGIQKNAIVTEVRNIKKNYQGIKNIQKVTCKVDKKNYHIEFPRDHFKEHNYHEGDNIEILIHPIENNKAQLAIGKENRKFYLKKGELV